jgi:hypothetical protein
MVLLLKNIIALWHERLRYLEAQRTPRASESWRSTVERRVLAYLLRRHGSSAHPSAIRSAEPLDPASSEASARLQKDERVKVRDFRSQEELAGIEFEGRRRAAYKQKLTRRSSLLLLFFVLLVLFLATAYLIISWLP